jgi:hypothetical protein
MIYGPTKMTFLPQKTIVNTIKHFSFKWHKTSQVAKEKPSLQKDPHITTIKTIKYLVARL